MLVLVEIEEKGYLLTLFGERNLSSLGPTGVGKILGDVLAFDVQPNARSRVEPNVEAPAPRGWFCRMR